MTKITVLVGYYELHVRPYKDGDINHKIYSMPLLSDGSIFDSLKEFYDKVVRVEFDDHIIISPDLESELIAEFGEFYPAYTIVGTFDEDE